MLQNKKILSVITARGGSKGIVGKNYRLLMDLPLFMWSVYASINSKYVDKTVISSNCVECLKVYLEYIKKDEKLKNVSWVQRPDQLATGTSKNEDALIHAVKYLNSEFDIIINLQPTSPCRYPTLIDDCIESYCNGSYQSLFTAGRHTPFFWQKQNKKWKYISGDNCCNRKMRQQFLENDENSEFLMHDNGCVFVMDTDVLLKTKCRVSNNHNIFETKGIYNFQIDEEYDFKFIEYMLNSMGKKTPID